MAGHPAPRAVILLVVVAGFLPATGQSLRNVTDNADERVQAAALDDAGNFVYALTDTDDHGLNPRRAFQVERFDAVSGTAAGITGFRDGVLDVQVSDDGQWLSLRSSGNLTGSNHDESVELFVINTDGTMLQQLTDDDDVLAPDITAAAFSGSGNRIAFWSRNDPLGVDPGGDGRMYVIERDGSGLAEVPGALAEPIAISDDGTRILFLAPADPLGTNADGTVELFLIRHDGGGLTQLTNLDRDVTDAALSGDGSRAVLLSSADPQGTNPNNRLAVFTVLWDASGLAQLSPGSGSASGASVVDDGSLVFFAAAFDEAQNPEANSEIWRVASDGSGLIALTQTGAGMQNFAPIVAGGGGRVAFRSRGGQFAGGNNPDGNTELMAMDAGGGSIVQLTDLAVDPESTSGTGIELTPDAGRIVYFTDRRPISLIASDGSGAADITPPVDYVTSVSASDTTVVFNSMSDLTGLNPSNNLEVFAVDLDGDDLRQLYVSAFGVNEHPVIAANDSWVVFQSSDVFPGGLMRIRPDGSDAGTVVNDLDSLYKWPDISADGNWVVYQSEASGTIEVYRIRIDGAQKLQVSTAGGDDPHVSGDGSLVVYDNGDCFLWSAGDLSTTALTGSGNCRQPRISDDGSAVWFLDRPELFDGVDEARERPYRYDVASGVVERVGGVARLGADSGGIAGYRNRAAGLAAAGSGDVLVFQGSGDWDGRNPTGKTDTYLVDRARPATIEVGKAAPTVVAWTADARYRRYDVVRGDVAQLQESGGAVDLGTLVCVEDDSPDVDTAGDEDPDVPAPGQAFFYLFRGTQGVAAGPDGYGFGSSGLERVAGGGDCGT